MEKTKLNLAVVQSDIAWEDPKANIKILEQKTKETEADIIVFPETFLTGFTMNTQEAAMDPDDRYIDKLKTISKEGDKAIALSVLTKSCDNKVYNRGYFITPKGEMFVQDKRHLFRFGGENDKIEHGKTREIIKYNGWKILMTICYDLRFPVWCRNQDNEYDLMINMANWPEPRNKVYTTLLQARAMENISYVAGANRIGQDKTGINHTGDSAIIDFKGNYMDMAKPNESKVVIAQLDKEKLDKFRLKFPAWMDQDKFKMEF